MVFDGGSMLVIANAPNGVVNRAIALGWSCRRVSAEHLLGERIASIWLGRTSFRVGAVQRAARDGAALCPAVELQLRAS